MAESRLDLKEFLNFLSTSCKVNVGEDADEMRNFNDNLNELTSNPLIKRLFDDARPTPCPSSSSAAEQVTEGDRVSVDRFNEIVDLLRSKLAELLNEGIFDSVLSYIAPKTIRATATKLNAAATGTGGDGKSGSHTPKRKREKKKKVSDSKRLPLQPKNEVEVEIQVYEEDEGLKKVFKCSQTLLVSSMPYFAEINKGRRLEEMDIMVHCEIATFDWLMKWVKRHSVDATAGDIPPKLNFKNVISIMSLANFLKMKPLFQDCLRFCKHNMNNVIKFTPNLSCLKDGVLKKLADLFDNVDVQNLEDVEDRIRSRLFSKLVKSLRETEPEKRHGHYASSAVLYSCSNCGKLVNRFTASHVPCRMQYVSVKPNGDILFKHSRDSTWNIDDHIKSIWTEYKNWSCTYWRLWSECHFLYCEACCTIYAVAFSDCCPYHPQQPHFNLAEQQFSTVSSHLDDNTGRYPCCGSKAIRNETLKIRSGCKLRRHSPRLLTNEDNCIQAIVDKFPELVKINCYKEDVRNFVENCDDVANLDILLKKASAEKDEQGANQGLLNGPLFDAHLKIIKKYKSINSWECKKECSNIQNLENRFDDVDVDSTSAGESENSDLSSCDFLTPIINKSEIVDTTLGADNPIQPKQPQNELKPVWTSRYPSRFYNEDNQRDYEEVAFQAICTVLMQCNDKQKCGSKDTSHEFSFPSGGSYAKIESEWKEARLTSSGNKLNKT